MDKINADVALKAKAYESAVAQYGETYAKFMKIIENPFAIDPKPVKKPKTKEMDIIALRKMSDKMLEEAHLQSEKNKKEYEDAQSNFEKLAKEIGCVAPARRRKCRK